jgi:aromatic-L-amino-acid decarboxylase
MTEEFLRSSARVAEWIASYRQRMEDFPVLARVEPGETAARLPASPPEAGEGIDEILADLDRIIVPGLTHWNHPGFLAYFSSSSTDPGVLAEFISAALNVNAMLWRTSPAATELEERMVEWIRQFVRLPQAFQGVIQDTASSSSFTALVAARERAVPGVRDRGLVGGKGLEACTLYLSDEAHSSLDKAAMAAGLGLDNVRRVGCDGYFRLDPARLEKALEEDLERGCRPVMVCATIGTTSSTSVDPVAQVAEICRRYGVWLHVDAAYAGPAASLTEKEAEFAGWERADSIVLNPHKWLVTPIDCSVLLYRDPEAFSASLALTPEYLQSHDDAGNLMDIGLAMGRRFRALKLWFVFRSYGAQGLRRMLRRHMELADVFAGWLQEDERFELAAPVPFSTVCFRGNHPTRGTADGLNRRLLEAVNSRGPVFLSATELAGRYTLRLAVGSAHVTEQAVRRAYDLLSEEYDKIRVQDWDAGQG